MGADCKSAGYAYAGSNPARPTSPCSSVVEHTLGKGEVTSSILVTGLLLQVGVIHFTVWENHGVGGENLEDPSHLY